MRLQRRFMRYLATVTRGMHKPQQKFIAQLLYGLLKSRSTMLSDIARALAEPCKLLYTEKRLSRNLGSSRFDFAQLRTNYLQRVGRELKEHVIAVDFSDIQKPYAKKMPYLSRVRDGSQSSKQILSKTDAPKANIQQGTVLGSGYMVLQAEAVGLGGNRIPLWTDVISPANPDYKSEAHEVREILTKLAPHVPDHAIWVFDRGFDSNRVFAFLDVAAVKYVVRLKTDKRIFFMWGGDAPTRMSAEDALNSVQPMHEFTFDRWRGRSGRVLKLSVGWARVKLLKYNPGGDPVMKGGTTSVPAENWFTIVTVRNLGQKPLMLLSNIEVKSAKDAELIAETYLWRWGVEEATRFEKSVLDLENLRVLTWDRLRRLALLVMLAYGFLAITNSDDLRKACAVVPAFAEVPRYLFYRAVELVQMRLRKPAPVRAAVQTVEVAP